MNTRNTAWMLRQDGNRFPVTVHLYASGDEDMSSEAECAAFILQTKSKDSELAQQVLDIWMALLVENQVGYDDTADQVDQKIRHQLSELPYRFSYPMRVDSLIDLHHKLGNFGDVGSLYDYLDSVNIEDYQTRIRKSINQQFCRVRYGGKYDTSRGNRTLWFRVSSVGYNWANTIYLCVSDLKRPLQVDSVSICRDYESDNGTVDGKPEYFYVAKDGCPYYMMPIKEYLAEEHEHSPVFSSCDGIESGVRHFIKSELSRGYTMYEIEDSLAKNNINIDAAVSLRSVFRQVLTNEIQHCCVESSEFLDSAPTVTVRRMMQVKRKIQSRFPELVVHDIDVKSRDNSAGNAVGCELRVEVSSELYDIDHIVIGAAFNKPLSTLTVDILVRGFAREYSDYLRFKKS